MTKTKKMVSWNGSMESEPEKETNLFWYGKGPQPTPRILTSSLSGSVVGLILNVRTS